MAVTWLGTGAAAAANNAAINLSVPTASYQAGDLLVAVLFIRENAGSWPAPAGWTQASSKVGGSMEYSMAVLYRYWQSGDSSFTFTPSGGGANDTVIGRILAFRGARDSNPIPNFTSENAVAGVNALDVYSGFAPTAQDGNLAIALKLDDSVSGTSSAFVNGFSLVTEDFASSTLGTDGTLYTAVYAGSASYATYTQMANISLPSTTSDFFAIGYLIKAEIAYTGSGGAVVGGAASTAFAPLGTFYAPTPAGGALAGGAATTETAIVGAHFRGWGSVSHSSGGLGNLNVSVPGTAQIGDLLLIFLKLDYQGSSYSTYPILPAGYTELAYQTNTQLQLMIGWKVATADDIGATYSVAFGNDVAGPYKTGIVAPFYNYAMVSGSPVVGSVAVDSSNSSNVHDLRQKATSYPLVKSFTVGVHSTASSRTLSSACLTDGWKILLSDSFSGFLAINTLDDINSIPIDTSCSGSTFNATAYTLHAWFGIAGAAETFEAPSPVGGAIVGGAGLSLPPGVDPFQWIASGGIIVAGPGDYVFNPKPFRQAYGFHSTWNSIGLPAGIISGWQLKTYANGIEKPCTQFTIRRRGSDLRVSLKLVGDLFLASGDIIEGELIYSIAGQTSFAQTIFTAAIATSRSGSGFTYVEALAENQVSYGASFEPSKIMVIQPGRIRIPVDWNVRPGDLYNGQIIDSVTTTVGTDSNWFTEVGYGQG